MDEMQQEKQQKAPGIVIAALILAFIFPVVGIILGIIALVKINETESKRGRGLAIAAIVTGVAMALIILPVSMVIVGSMAYYGVLDPGRFLPDSCQFENPILCDGDRFVIRESTTRTLEASLINNYGSQIVVSDAVVEAIDGKELGCDEILLDNVNISKGNQEMVWEQGSRKNLIVNCVNVDKLNIQENAILEIEMQWHPSGYQPSESRVVRGKFIQR